MRTRKTGWEERRGGKKEGGGKREERRGGKTVGIRVGVGSQNLMTMFYMTGAACVYCVYIYVTKVMNGKRGAGDLTDCGESMIRWILVNLQRF